MEYISAEEFLKQSDKVQREFKEYFDCETMLFYSNDQLIYGEFNDILINTPAVTEGQLRKFIEDKTGYKVEVYIDCDGEYTIMLCRDTYLKYKTIETDLLQAYWKVACEIASSEVNKHE